MPKAITALTRLVQPLSVVIRLFTADDGYQANANSQPRPQRRYRRGLNG